MLLHGAIIAARFEFIYLFKMVRFIQIHHAIIIMKGKTNCFNIFLLAKIYML